jgi:hypothetical protein
MKRSIARVRRQEKALNDYVLKAIFFEDIKEAINNDTPLNSNIKKTNKLQSWWYTKARPICDKIFAILMGTFSIILLIS